MILKRKVILILTSIFVLLSFSLVRPMVAANFFNEDLVTDQLDVQNKTVDKSGFGDQANVDVSMYIGGIVNGLAGVLGVLIFLIILYAGFLWLTAGGNEDQVTKAKLWLRNGLIGLAIVTLAYALALLLTAALTQGANYGQVDPPNI